MRVGDYDFGNNITEEGVELLWGSTVEDKIQAYENAIKNEPGKVFLVYICQKRIGAFSDEGYGTVRAILNNIEKARETVKSWSEKAQKNKELLSGTAIYIEPHMIDNPHWHVDVWVYSQLGMTNIRDSWVKA